MANLVDFSKFQFTAEQIRDVRDLIWDEIVKAPEFSEIMNIYPNVVAGKQVGFITKGGLVIKADAGCGSAASDWQIGTRSITWEPKAWEAYVTQCYSELENTAAVYAMNKGVKRADLTDTDYMAIVVDVMSESIKESLFAIALYGDTQSANANISLVDGFKKQMDAQVTLNAAQGVTLSTNSIVSSVVAMIQAADPVLRADSTAKIYASQKVYDTIVAGLISANASSAAYAALIDGTTARILGVDIVAVPLIDEIAATISGKADFAFYTAPKYLGLGVDSDAFGEVETFYMPDTKKTGIRALGKMDAKLMNPKMFVLGTLA